MRAGLTALLLLLAANAHSETTRTYAIGSANGSIRIDGVIESHEWGGASPIDLPFETSPGDNVPAPVKTQALLAYDQSTLYVAIRAWDPDTKAIRANLTDRDNAYQDDFAGIVVDTFNDQRRAFEFFVNPLGVQMDLTNADVDGGNEDDSWDAIWRSAGRIHEDRWEVEMAIPFSALRFRANDGEQTWGLDIVRIYPRSHRRRIGLNALDRNRDCYICQFSKLTGFRGIRPGNNMELAPTVTAHRTDARPVFPTQPIARGSFETDPGVTARWGVTPNIILNGALNPDFSQVEADSPQLDVNNTFTLFFNEKRPFFLEGADFFRTPLEAVYTRTISDPDWGLKMTGKEGKSGGGAFVAGDAVTNVIVPGPERSGSITIPGQNVSGVLRYRYDLGKNSTLGALLTSRSGDGYANHVAGVDGFFRFAQTNSISAQILTSRTEYPQKIVTAFEQPSGTFGDVAARVRYRHDSRNWFAKASYDDVGDRFRADSGFMPRVGYRYADAGFQRTWWRENRSLSRFFWGSDWDRTEKEDGFLLEQEFETWFGFAGPAQSFLEVDFGRRERSFNSVEFGDEDFLNIYSEITPHKQVYIQLEMSLGDTIDFTNVRPARRVRYTPFVRYRATRNLLFELRHDRERLHVEGGELYTASVNELRTVYQFNLRTFLRALVQYTDIQRDPSLYHLPVAEHSKRFFPQLLFSYKLNPQTVLFVGYSSTQLADDETIDLLEHSRTFFVKVGYAWLM